MILWFSKTITWTPKRQEALDLLKTAIQEYVIQGVTVNTRFGLSILNHPAFVVWKYDTSFIPKYYPNGYHEDKKTDDEKEIIAISTARLKNINRHESATIDFDPKDLTRVYVHIDDQDYQVDICPEHETYTVQVVGTDKAHWYSMNDFIFKYNCLVKFNSRREDMTQHQILQFTELPTNLTITGSTMDQLPKSKKLQSKTILIESAHGSTKINWLWKVRDVTNTRHNCLSCS